MVTAPSLTEQVRRAARQEQFLEVLSAEEATRRFRAALDLAPLEAETVGLAEALHRVVAQGIAAAADAPPFDRSSVDGFALRAADTAGATEASPRRLRLNGEVLACGTAPAIEVLPGTATAIATGGVIPRGADAVVMIEHTELEEGGGAAIALRRAAAPGQFIGFAGSDIARGEALLRAGTTITSREIGMLAAAGHATVPVVRRPRVAILSTGDELVPPGTTPLPPGAIPDSNAAILAAAVAEHGGEPLPLGIFRDDEAVLEQAVRRALETADLVVMSGGTSKGAGDVSHRIIGRLGPPGVLAHGVALKPGKPLCLAAVGRKPLVVLPGFPTSAVFTFHEFVVPVIRALAGLPPRAETTLEASLAIRTPSELGRTEYVMVSLSETADGEGLTAWPLGKGSGSVTAFSQADGFFAIPALAQGAEAGMPVQVRLIGEARLPELSIIGSHCVGLDDVLEVLAEQGIRARTLAVGSLGGLAAARRGECDLAPAHLLDAKTGLYNTPWLEAGLRLVPGWRRIQGVVFRPGDARFEGLDGAEAIRRAAADPACLLVNRNAGSGTRILLDGLLGGARPPGYPNQPKSHNAVATAVAQGRADWGMAIGTVARAYGLGFLPIADEHYDFFVPEARLERPALQAFLAALESDAVRERLRVLGFTPA
ncbi:molybdopterin biosynthesis protein [Pseudoroseomonas wenyumeiae]|uniref:Molybdopterin molybdenumtransferase n=1 Tax=Teichococcus wenyumeiae TaxID=2478470 RepID=A0A3A9JIM2_9PROT|nr:molybdopterin biosynthesis protein [Pseudoroseomonas wenyumeiae]RKK05081.1 molybdopterin biosynthesis protein [Pseudoroseomonas wenyumeiae]RMI25153.1 molybdopterin biosynthesis protein [Pseudoroseomonas wenyumeiae]